VCAIGGALPVELASAVVYQPRDELIQGGRADEAPARISGALKAIPPVVVTLFGEQSETSSTPQGMSMLFLVPNGTSREVGWVAAISQVGVPRSRVLPCGDLRVSVLVTVVWSGVRLPSRFPPLGRVLRVVSEAVRISQLAWRTSIGRMRRKPTLGDDDWTRYLLLLITREDTLDGFGVSESG